MSLFGFTDKNRKDSEKLTSLFFCKREMINNGKGRILQNCEPKCFGVFRFNIKGYPQNNPATTTYNKQLIEYNKSFPLIVKVYKLPNNVQTNNVTRKGGSLFDKFIPSFKPKTPQPVAQRNNNARLAVQGTNNANPVAQRNNNARLAVQGTNNAKPVAQGTNNAQLAVQGTNNAKPVAQRNNNALPAANQTNIARPAAQQQGKLLGFLLFTTGTFDYIYEYSNRHLKWDGYDYIAKDAYFLKLDEKNSILKMDEKYMNENFAQCEFVIDPNIPEKIDTTTKRIGNPVEFNDYDYNKAFQTIFTELYDEKVTFKSSGCLANTAKKNIMEWKIKSLLITLNINPRITDKDFVLKYEAYVKDTVKPKFDEKSINYAKLFELIQNDEPMFYFLKMMNQIAPEQNNSPAQEVDNAKTTYPEATATDPEATATDPEATATDPEATATVVQQPTTVATSAVVQQPTTVATSAVVQQPTPVATDVQQNVVAPDQQTLIVATDDTGNKRAAGGKKRTRRNRRKSTKKRYAKRRRNASKKQKRSI